MLKKDRTRYLQFALVGLLVVALYFGAQGLFAVTAGTPPTCTFNGTGDTCEYTYTLDANRAASVLTFDFEFAPIQDTELSPEVQLSLLDTQAVREENTANDQTGTVYLYDYPSAWADVEPYDIVLRSTSRLSVSCNSRGEDAEAFFKLIYIGKPYPYNTVRVCSDAQCDIDDTSYLVEQDRDNDGDDYYQIKSNGGLLAGTDLRCYYSNSDADGNDPYEIYTEDRELIGTVPNNQIYGRDAQRFVVEMYRQLEFAGTPSASWTQPNVYASYHAALWPTDVTYEIGGLTVDTLEGVQKNLTTSLDLSQQVNILCSRGTNVDSCNVTLTFTSQEAGLMWVSTNTETLAFASIDDRIAQYQDEINQLEGDLQAQIAYINALDATIEEKAAIIAELELIQADQVEMIQGLELSIEEQAVIINQLTQNLEEKAALVDQLTATNEEQAALIAAMEESFADQGAIISRLNNTIEEDAELIQRLTMENEEQAEIIAGFDDSLVDESALVAQLRSTVEEQQELIEQIEADRIRLQQTQSTGGATTALVAAVLLVGAGGALWWRRRR